jgi:predicted DNA binding CopG/RHH family protein
MYKTNDKERYSLRIPQKYLDAVKRDASVIGTTRRREIQHAGAVGKNGGESGGAAL